MKRLSQGALTAFVTLVIASPASAADSGDSFNFDGIQKVISFVVNWMMVIAPALITLSFVWCAFLWTVAGNNRKMVDRAKKQFVATCVSLGIIVGYFVIKGVILALSLGTFGE
jgi:Type IV secretion system pilin